MQIIYVLNYTTYSQLSLLKRYYTQNNILLKSLKRLLMVESPWEHLICHFRKSESSFASVPISSKSSTRLQMSRSFQIILKRLWIAAKDLPSKLSLWWRLGVLQNVIRKGRAGVLCLLQAKTSFSPSVLNSLVYVSQYITIKCFMDPWKRAAFGIFNLSMMNIKKCYVDLHSDWFFTRP